jgi:hypothetical protein
MTSVCTHIYGLNGHRRTMQSKILPQHVSSEPQFVLGQYITLVSTAQILIHHKIDHMELPHCLPSYEEIEFKRVHPVVCMMNNTNMFIIIVEHNLYYILIIARLHVSTLWGSSSGLYNILKPSIHKLYFAKRDPVLCYICI